MVLTYPETMMVKFIYTPLTLITMFSSIGLNNTAYFTIVFCRHSNLNIFKRLLEHF